MNIASALFIVGMSFLTAAISGVFGMAGGLLLKGSLALVLPVSATFFVHGVLQLVANGWRAILHRKHVNWRIVGVYALGAFVAAGIMAYVALEPTKATLYLLMGLVPGIWALVTWLRERDEPPAPAGGWMPPVAGAWVGDPRATSRRDPG